MIDEVVKIEIKKTVSLGINGFGKNNFSKISKILDVCPNSEFPNFALNGNIKPNKKLQAKVHRVEGDFSFRSIFEKVFSKDLTQACFLQSEIMEFCEESTDMLLEDYNLWLTLFLTKKEGKIVVIGIESDGCGKIFFDTYDLDEEAGAILAYSFCYIVVPFI